MVRKKSAMLTILGTAVILAGTAWLSQGCSLTSDECICSTDLRFQYAAVVDELSQPVDSATVRLYRVSDNKELAKPDFSHTVPSKGSVVVFSDGHTKDFPEGESQVEIRAVVSKGAKTGEERYVFGQDKCGCHFEKISGRDTITIR